ncbi:hypothetical protein LJC45_05210, partial [Alistipes sp. OttesenSCG-928-B03]|nr:hypothetical protein [Alistipes sp. OttesenSCG-928-B03]
VYAGGVSVQNFLNISGRELILKGFPVDGFYSYRFGGLDDNGAPTFPALGNEYATEYDRLQDLLVYEGTKVPKTYGGFGTQVSFKGFTLTSNFTYKAGYKVRLLSLYPNGIYVPLPNENMRGEFADRWRQPGDRTNIPALSDDPMKIDMPYGAANLLLPYGDGSTLYQLYDLSDERTAKGDHIRWQSLALSYNCPKRWISAIGMRSMTIRFQVQNLAVWTFDGKLKGQDPEQVSQIGMPSLTSYNIGINIGF